LKTANKFLLALLLTITSLYSDCDQALENPHELSCGGFSLDIGDFDSPCCSYGTTKFDIFDAFRNGSDDKNISTKIINTAFDLNITSKNDFNGTICVAIKSTNEQSDWTKVDFNNSKIVTINDANVSFLAKKAGIYLKFKENDDANCSATLDGDDNSDEAFAIRPKEFFIKATSFSMKAGEDFNLSFIAGYDEDTPSKDYNESNEDSDASFDVTISELKSGCSASVFSPNITNDVNFSNGLKDFENISYDDVGEVNLTIAEDLNCSKRYASIDCNDKETSEWKLSITPKEVSIKIVPYEFSIEVVSSNFNNEAFTYLANEKEKISAKLDINITAISKNDLRVKNYNDSCYATDLDIKLVYEDINDTNLGDFIYFHKNSTTSTNDTDVTKNDDVLFVLEKKYFRDTNDENGSALFELNYNFSRNFSKPVSPFDLNISTMDVNDVDNIDGNYTNDSFNAQFCYGRVLSKDVKTNDASDIEKNIFIEVYDDKATSYTSGFSQTALKWYRHKNHSNNLDGNITAIDATLKSILNDIQFSINDITAPSEGKIDIIIPKHEGSYTLHIKTDKWLWYGLENFSDPYNDATDSSCAEHPCFNYSLQADSNDFVQSGNYAGGNIEVKDRGDSTKSGIKVFR